METLDRNHVSERAKLLVEELRDVIRVEQAWAIAQRYLDEIWLQGKVSQEGSNTIDSGLESAKDGSSHGGQGEEVVG